MNIYYLISNTANSAESIKFARDITAANKEMETSLPATIANEVKDLILPYGNPESLYAFSFRYCMLTFVC